MFVYLKVKIFEWLQQRKVARLFYPNKVFQLYDRRLLKAYQNQNPYKISKNFLIQNKAPNIFAYGETPLTTMDLIARECELSAKDLVIEMGAGRGRAALFLAAYWGCQVIGYEQISSFVEKMPLFPKLKMEAQDMFSADFSKATVIYLYGTMLEDGEILKLLKRFPTNVKIITVSYPLSDYSKNYMTKKGFQGLFPWGKAKVYWNERIS